MMPQGESEAHEQDSILTWTIQWVVHPLAEVSGYLVNSLQTKQERLASISAEGRTSAPAHYGVGDGVGPFAWMLRSSKAISVSTLCPVSRYVIFT